MRTNTRRQGVAATALIAIGSALSSTGCETDRFVQPRIETTALAQVVRSGGVPIEVKTGFVAADGTFVPGPVPPLEALAVAVRFDAEVQPSQLIEFSYSATESLVAPRTSLRYAAGTDTMVDGVPHRLFRLARTQLFEGNARPVTIMVATPTGSSGERRRVGAAAEAWLSPTAPLP